MKKIKVFVALCFLFQMSYAQKQLPEDVRASIRKRIEMGHAPSIVVGIIDKDGPRYFTFGTKTVGGQAVNEHTIYEIGSISKTFTGILLAQMALEGKLKVEDPTQTHLPEAVKIPTRGGKQITLGQLSDHTSSLPRLPGNLAPKNAANPYSDYTTEQLYDFINAHTLARDIGSTFDYSNLAAGLLGHILSLKAGLTYENLMIKKIALPLGMKETKVSFNKPMMQNLAMGHSNGKQVSNWDLPTLGGAGAIRSSLYDMLRYVGANMGLQKSKFYPAMQLSHKARHDKAGGGTRVGLAWFIAKGAEGDIIWHNGGTGGYRTFAGFVKETGIGVVVLTNSDKGADDIGMHLLNSSSKLIEIKKSILGDIQKSLDTKGTEAAWKTYEEFKKDKAAYEFDENSLNALGYTYLAADKTAEALAIFKINMDAFPTSFNVFDSYAEALMKVGKKDSAIIYYKKSLELNPANTNATDMLAKINGNETKEVKVEESILANYVGIYELAPGFTITITQSGQQLFGQATGQEKFELFASSNTDFFLKVVPAKVSFFTKNGKPESLTLFQGGREMPGKKIK